MCESLEEWLNETLKDIEKNPEKYKFEPGAYYNDTGDILHAHWKESSYYAEWINHRITLLRDQETKEVVGCQVWGLKAKVLKDILCSCTYCGKEISERTPMIGCKNGDVIHLSCEGAYFKKEKDNE